MELRFPARQGGFRDGTTYNCTSFAHRSHPPIWICSDCGLLFQWPRASERGILELYRAVEDPLYVTEKENRYRTFRRVVRMLGAPAGRALLDVGAYCGYFVDVAAQAGFHAEGLEVSRWAARQAHSLGLTIYEQTLAERASSGARYQVLTLWDCLEHFCDPRAELQEAFRLLDRGGMLYLSTIDAGSVPAKLFGSRWPWLMDMHLFYFDRRTIALLLEAVGFEVTEIRTYTHVVSAEYLFRKLAASWSALAPLFALVARLVPRRLSVPINLGDNMMVVARKP